MKKLLILATVAMAAPLSAQQTVALVQTAPAPPAPGVAIAAPVPATGPTATEVAGIVAREFPAYDKDASGALSAAEFAAWMVRLKTIADPSVTADAPSTRTWLNAAFAQADADRSRSLTLGELTGFLSQGQS